ncbi:hypothetical protein HKD37_02G004043 [Glycine soja]
MDEDTPREVGVCDDNGGWRLNRFSQYLPDDINLKVMRMTSPDSNSEGEQTSDGLFSVKTAYEVVVNPLPSHNHRLFSCLQQWRGTERIRMFLWKICHESILTNVRRMRMYGY